MQAVNRAFSTVFSKRSAFSWSVSDVFDYLPVAERGLIADLLARIIALHSLRDYRTTGVTLLPILALGRHHPRHIATHHANIGIWQNVPNQREQFPILGVLLIVC